MNGKMKLKKIVSLATSVVLSTSLLVGCSGKNKGNGGNVSNEKGTLKISFEPSEVVLQSHKVLNEE